MLVSVNFHIDNKLSESPDSHDGSNFQNLHLYINT